MSAADEPLPPEATPVPSVAPERPQTPWRSRLAISLLCGLGLAWILLRGGLPLYPPDGSFDLLRPWTVVAYVASLAAVHWFRAARWRHLLRPLGRVSLRDVISVSWVGFGAILLSPLRSGEIVRPYLVTRRSSVRMWEATGTVGAERVIDGLALSTILFVALRRATPLDPLPDHIGDLPVPVAAVPGAANVALFLFFSAFVAMAVFFFARDFARRATQKVVGLVSARLGERVADIVDRVAQGIRFLPSPRHLLPFLLETAAYWSVNAAGVWLLAWGSGLSGITPAEACVAMGCLGIGILVPSGPGYFGAFQLSTYMALAMYFPEHTLRGPGAAFVFVLYASQVGFHLFGLGLGLWMLRRAPESFSKAEALG
ncbi:lysylphosphatidylglycerol synthase transmembrane domain-containing protein [Polyangium jinanense]|uniref:Flippase-like domain-containing protein n=1 Tax=Polyangium jinanense TaxID=2829994 RepID=A0A9X3X8M7_9BACT|nr:lysylphosphatidylglycerol synthase transmembrane domain-containing protein [Polyangium jinanense]MDC3960086.1 flippase-like domain-containing protein [Polyangium jinanense]MDC3984403.1 flippase-like domain-containing protein [Polyangium jinanense]